MVWAHYHMLVPNSPQAAFKMFARICFLSLALLANPCFTQVLALPNSNNAKNPEVETNTSHEKKVLELFSDKTPATVNNFPSYVQSDHYNNSINSRVAKDFHIQGSAYGENLLKNPQRSSVAREVSPVLKNRRGTVAAARKLSDNNCATSNFFFNLVDNPQLDFQSNISPLNQGFAVLAQIIDGIEVIDKIRKVATTDKRGFSTLSTTPVVIRLITRVGE